MRRLLLPLLATLAMAVPAAATAWQVEQEASLLAVVTHKGGFAAGLAHDHLVAASSYEARLEFDPASPAEALFELQAAADGLVAHPPGLHEQWYPRLEELGILSEPFRKVSEKDRRKIRRAMLGKKQLDAARFPTISAWVVRVEEEASTSGEVSFSHRVTLGLEVHGERVERPVAARYSLEGDALTVEAVGSFAFTEFGIKPYSAALGAVKNQDRFHLYLHLIARPAEERSTEN
ncbi:MAG: YceI family protein [Thermoanaerobaculia bacterium]